MPIWRATPSMVHSMPHVVWIFPVARAVCPLVVAERVYEWMRHGRELAQAERVERVRARRSRDVPDVYDERNVLGVDRVEDRVVRGHDGIAFRIARRMVWHVAHDGRAEHASAARRCR